MRHSGWLSFASLLGAVLAVLPLSAAPAAAADKAAAMVIDANTGRVLHDKSGNELRYPASLTKMMTLYLAFETIEAGRLSFTTPISVSDHAAAAAPSELGLEAGSEIPLRDAIKALVVKSANDVAIAIAEKIGGSEDDFARLMTKRARQIGMRDTTFRNASGLPDPEQVTTARDMLTLAMRLQDDFPQHYRLFSTRTFSFGGKTYRSHNALLGRFAGVDGIKTGYTRASGFNLVSSYQSGSKHVVAAVFGGVSAGLRDAHMRMLLARAIEKASKERTRKAGPQLIADAKPAKRPEPKPVIKPEPPATPKPASVAVAVADAGPVSDPSTGTASDAAPPTAPQAAPSPRIAIAKVKTVSVLPPAAAADVGAGTDEASAGDNAATATVTPDTAVQTAAALSPDASQPANPLTYASTVPRPDFAALKARLAARAAEPADAETGRATFAPSSAAPGAELPAGTAETIMAKDERARPPSTFQAQLASFAGNDPSHLGAPPADDKPALHAAVAELPAPVPVPVSTGMSRVPAVPPAPRAAPAVAVTPSGFHVQIGVYSSTSDAERAMAAAKKKAGHVLGDRSSIAVPVTKGDRQLYRARFAGFDSASATNVCNELRRNGLDCFVARSN